MSSVQRTWKVVGEKRKKIERIPVKYKSAEMYVGRPNEAYMNVTYDKRSKVELEVLKVKVVRL